MFLRTAKIALLFALLSCNNTSNSLAKDDHVATSKKPPHYNTIEQIPLPAGYTRIPVEASSFAAWLRTITLKTDNTVYLFDGRKKRKSISTICRIGYFCWQKRPSAVC